jgi:serine protease
LKLHKTFVFALSVLVASSAFAGKREVIKKEKKVPDQYIVVFEDSVDDVEAVANDLAYLHRGQVDRIYKKALKGFSVKLNEKKALDVAADPRVRYVEEDGVVEASTTQSGATWGLDRIDQRDLPLNSTYTYTPTGQGVTAYIIDTGVLGTHAQFGGRVRSGYTAINDGRGSTDCNGHGTHVAGTVGGSTYGVAKNVSLVAVRVLDCSGNGTDSGVIGGVDWVTSDHAAGSPAVANMSLGGGVSQALDDAVNRSINDGVTYAVAAGNDYGADACNGSPSRVAGAITVGSTTNTDARSSFSNIGACLDIFAPGSNITSAWYTSTTATNTISGTSMATPHVAGVAALYLQGNPSASPSAVWAAIRDTSTPNKVTSPGTGSPNRLLYSLLTTGGGGGGGGTTVPSLTNGQTVSSLSGGTGAWAYYKIAVPSGQTKLEIKISGGTGDADLYVKFGAQPSASSYDYRPYLNGNNETVTVTNPAAGEWYIGLHAYSAYSGMSLVATYSTSTSTCTSYSGSLSATGASAYQPSSSGYSATTSGSHTGKLTGPSSADFDLYLQKWNGSSWAIVARGESSTSAENVTYSGTSGSYRWRVYSYSGSGSYTLCTTRPN